MANKMYQVQHPARYTFNRKINKDEAASGEWEREREIKHKQHKRFYVNKFVQISMSSILRMILACSDNSFGTKCEVAAATADYRKNQIEFCDT